MTFILVRHIQLLCERYVINPTTHSFFCLCFFPFDNTLNGRCKYIDRSQWDYFTKGLWIVFSLFSLFHMKEFLNEIFCNLLLEIHIVSPIDHMFCVNHFWINMKFSMCVNFARFYISFWKIIIILNHTKIC
jgi:hypothetical protein